MVGIFFAKVFLRKNKMKIKREVNMRTRQDKKKLVLNKISVALLDKDISSQVKGGVINDSAYDQCPWTEKTKIDPVCTTTTTT